MLMLKPLEWKSGHTTFQIRAETSIGCYWVDGSGPVCRDDRWWLYFNDSLIGKFSNEEPAKAAAQTDYEARILSAKEQVPDTRGDLPPLEITYTNWRGETSERRIIPRSLWHGVTEWHPSPQWLLRAWDCEKQAERDFALKDFGGAMPDTRDKALEAGMHDLRAAKVEARRKSDAALEAAERALEVSIGRMKVLKSVVYSNRSAEKIQIDIDLAEAAVSHVKEVRNG